MSWVIAVVVVDDATGSVLVDSTSSAEGSGVARLPTVDLPDGEPSTDLTLDLVERLLGRPIAPLWLNYEEDDDTIASGVGAVMTLADAARDAAPDRTFVPAADVLDTLEPAHTRGHIRAWLRRRAGDVDPRTPPWLDPGWHARASAWIADRMTAAGRPPAGPSRMTYQSQIGIVLRTRSAEGDVYMKCPAPQFLAEASITRALALRTPGWVPEVLAIEPSEGWLLMADLGERLLGGEPEPTWTEGIRRLGEVQRAWVDHTDELVAAGGARRALRDITDALPGLLEIDGLGDRLEPKVRAGWPDISRRLADACQELEDIGLPDALVHGDAHPWNVAVTDRGHVVFDWSDAAVGQSFMDLAVFLRRTKDLAIRRVLRDAYLDAWSGIAPRDRLDRAAELAMTVGALYQVRTYQTLLPGLPPEDSVVYAGADANWLRNAIDALTHGIDSVDQRSC